MSTKFLVKTKIYDREIHTDYLSKYLNKHEKRKKNYMKIIKLKALSNTEN